MGGIRLREFANKAALLTIFVLLIAFFRGGSDSQRLGKDMSLKFLENYFRNNRLIDFQSKCLFADSPCDIIGQWLKPRMRSGLLGEKCESCTPGQSDTVANIIAHFKTYRPDIYEKAVVKFLSDGQLLDLLKKEYLRVTFQRNNLLRRPPGSSPELLDGTETEEIFNTAETANLGRRDLTGPHPIHENIVPGRYSYAHVDPSWWRLLATPKSSRSFTIPILTKF